MTQNNLTITSRTCIALISTFEKSNVSVTNISSNVTNPLKYPTVPELVPCLNTLHADWPALPHCVLFCVVRKVRSHLAALKSSSSVASSNSTATPPVVLRSHSFTEPLTPSFENLHLQNSHESRRHLPSSSSPLSSSSSTPARTDPHPHPQPRPYEPAPSAEVPPRVRTRRKKPSVVALVE